MKKYLLILAVMLFQPAVIHAADYEVQMLDFGTEGGMVFEPGFLAVEPGDTITFRPAASGHFVRSARVPDGVKEWRSALDEAYTVTVDKSGVYVYYCPPHLTMAMVGVIQVGDVSASEAFTEEMKSFNRRHLMNKKRLWSYIGQIQWSEQ